MQKSIILLCYLPAILFFYAEGSTITVVTEVFPPYQTQSKDKVLAGCSTDVVKKLFAETGDTAEIIVLPWSRAYTMAQQTPNVMIYSIAHNEIRNNLFYWLGVLVPAEHYILELWGLSNQFSINSINENQLKTYNIATTTNSSPHQFMQENNFSAIYPVTSLDQGLQMLMLGRVDIIAGSERSLRERSEHLGIDFSQLVNVFQLTNTGYPLSVAFNINSDAAVLAKYKAAWSKLLAEGTIKQLMAPCLAEK